MQSPSTTASAPMASCFYSRDFLTPPAPRSSGRTQACGMSPGSPRTSTELASRWTRTCWWWGLPRTRSREPAQEQVGTVGTVGDDQQAAASCLLPLASVHPSHTDTDTDTHQPSAVTFPAQWLYAMISSVHAITSSPPSDLLIVMCQPMFISAMTCAPQSHCCPIKKTTRTSGEWTLSSQ